MIHIIQKRLRTNLVFKLFLLPFLYVLVFCFPLNAQEAKKILLVTIQKPWKAQKQILYSSNGHSNFVDSLVGTIAIERSDAYKDLLPVIAFVNPTTGNVWAERQMGYYVDTGSEIVGIDMGAGALYWSTSLVKKITTHENVEKLTARFEGSIMGFNRWEMYYHGTDITAYLSDRFFDLPVLPDLRPDVAKDEPRPSAQKLTIFPSNFSVDKNVLQLTLISSAENVQATVWVDLKTRSVVRSLENGHQVFPK